MVSPFARSIPLHGVSLPRVYLLHGAPCTVTPHATGLARPEWVRAAPPGKATAALPMQRPPWRSHVCSLQQSDWLPPGPFPARSRAATWLLPLAAGFVNTQLFRHMPLWLKPLFLPLAWLFFLDASEGAQTPLHCATAEGLERFSGRYFADCRLQEPWPSGRDDRLAQALWEASERLVGLGGAGGSPSPAPHGFEQ